MMDRADRLPGARVAAARGEDPMSVPADWPNRSVSRQVLSFGTRWHVQRMGEGPTLVLIHGTGSSTHSFRDLLPLLSTSFDVLAVDLPGHGFSSRLPDGAMTLSAIARGLSGLFETLDVTPRYLVGHSAGAAIALRFALDAREAPEAIVGLNAALLPFGGMLTRVFSPLAQFFASTKLMPGLLARRAQDRKAVERVIRGTGSVIDAAGIDGYQRLFRREAHLSAVLAMMASWELSRLRQELPALDNRVLLMAGARDRAVNPGEATRVADHMRRAEVITLEDSGHLAHEERPEQVAAIIRRFCMEPGEPLERPD